MRKIALINDTSTGGHYGCASVMEVIDRLFASNRASIVHKQPVGTDWRNDQAARAAINAADIVIVNGEGSIHHSSERARQLSAVGPYCADLRKPAYLINATLEALDQATIDAIRHFTHVWVRDSASSAVLTAAHVPHTVGKDLSMCASFPSRSAPQCEAVYVDSVVPAAVANLRALSARSGLPLLVMKRDSAGNCLGLKTGSTAAQPIFPCATYSDFAAVLAGARHLVTGRFHAACFAVAMRIPFVAFPSNTRKIESLVEDIGLDPRRILDPEMPDVDMFDYSAEERDAIDHSLKVARSVADSMAQRIVAT